MSRAKSAGRALAAQKPTGLWSLSVTVIMMVLHELTG